MEISINHYYESRWAKITLFFIRFKLPLWWSLEGYDYGVSFSRLGFHIIKNDVTKCFYWKKLLKRQNGSQSSQK